MNKSQLKKEMEKKPEDRDYDYVFGKLPRKDKDGKDTTGDKIGKGGRHSDDGTFLKRKHLHFLFIFVFGISKSAQQISGVSTEARQ